MKTESQVTKEVLIKASERGMLLLRNNSGVARESDPTTGKQRVVRYGLGNESKRINDKFKSSDLIGISPVVITPDMVGKTLGVFTAVEVKKEGWAYKGTSREVAQNNFLDKIRKMGGYGFFINDVADL
jgi:hypothetical protein